ncbi:hypothetical protein ACIBEJ_33875 [Nonomuraea sp. NPDC050790]|uniref:hypothetical protein n=1 Tax=Nonomuraea sp. NPDC050790 TaxID=3364371 RepID=UPI003798CCFC
MSLVLIWSAKPSSRLESACARFERAEQISVPAFHERLPLPTPALAFPAGLAGPPSTDLPLVDFPLFLATARRRLDPEMFA